MRHKEGKTCWAPTCHLRFEGGRLHQKWETALYIRGVPQPTWTEKWRPVEDYDVTLAIERAKND